MSWGPPFSQLYHLTIYCLYIVHLPRTRIMSFDKPIESTPFYSRNLEHESPAYNKYFNYVLKNERWLALIRDYTSGEEIFLKKNKQNKTVNMC